MKFTCETQAHRLGRDREGEKERDAKLTNTCVLKGEVSKMEQATISEQEKYEALEAKRENCPSIKLSIRWHPHVDSKHTSSIKDSPLKGTSLQKGSHSEAPCSPMQFYSRLQLPSISFSAIDSIRAREVVQLCAAGVEMRHYITEDLTESVVNISSIQVLGISTF